MEQDELEGYVIANLMLTVALSSYLVGAGVIQSPSNFAAGLRRDAEALRPSSPRAADIVCRIANEIIEQSAAGSDAGKAPRPFSVIDGGKDLKSDRDETERG